MVDENYKNLEKGKVKFFNYGKNNGKTAMRRRNFFANSVLSVAGFYVSDLHTV